MTFPTFPPDLGYVRFSPRLIFLVSSRIIIYFSYLFRHRTYLNFSETLSDITFDYQDHSNHPNRVFSFSCKICIDVLQFYFRLTISSYYSCDSVTPLEAVILILLLFPIVLSFNSAGFHESPLVSSIILQFRNSSSVGRRILISIIPFLIPCVFLFLPYKYSPFLQISLVHRLLRLNAPSFGSSKIM